MEAARPTIRPFLGAVLLLASLSTTGCATVARRACTDDGFSEVDKVIAVYLFSPTLRIYPDGRRVILMTPSHPSIFGISPELHPKDYANTKRAIAAFEEHYRLLEEDPAYRERWEKAAAEALEKIGGNTRISYREGTRIVYPIFLRACIYHDIFARLGPPKVTDDPYYDGKDDPDIWGPDDGAFFFIDHVGGPSWPPSVMPFHYCAGTGGLTVSGGTDEPHVRAMLWLKEHDPEFRRDWEEVLRKVAPEAEKVDPLDAEAGNRVTAFWRTLLLQGGEKSLAARIEARVREEQREREKQQQQENDPDHP